MAAPPRALGGCGALAGSTAHRSRSTQYHSPHEQPVVASGSVKPHHRQLRLRSPDDAASYRALSGEYDADHSPDESKVLTSMMNRYKQSYPELHLVD